MYSNFQATHAAFVRSGIENPLEEMFTMLDILAQGKIRQATQSIGNEDGFKLANALEKRQEGMPWQYILGQATFMELSLNCTPEALIPREETELLAKTILALLEGKKGETVIDMGTGSGNIAVSLAYYAPQIHVYASDISADAVKLAQKNVDKFNLQEQISLFCGDLFKPLENLNIENAVDVVICNPPYIPTNSLDKLTSEIIDYEPVVALDAGPYGINIYRRLIDDALRFLKPGGILAFEIGAGQDKIAMRLLSKSGQYQTVSAIPDENGVNRVITAVR